LPVKLHVLWIIKKGSYTMVHNPHIDVLLMQKLPTRKELPDILTERLGTDNYTVFVIQNGAHTPVDSAISIMCEKGENIVRLEFIDNDTKLKIIFCDDTRKELEKQICGGQTPEKCLDFEKKLIEGGHAKGSFANRIKVNDDGSFYGQAIFPIDEIDIDCLVEVIKLGFNVKKKKQEQND
jgi:hypothetical protein